MQNLSAQTISTHITWYGRLPLLIRQAFHNITKNLFLYKLSKRILDAKIL